MDDQVTITVKWSTLEYLAILIGQTNWGNNKRRGPAAEDLSNGMGRRKLDGSLDCFDLKEDPNSAMKKVAAEKRAILNWLRSKSGTEELVAGIESGLHHKKESK